MATWPSILPVPLLSGYQVQPGDPTARTSMESGPARVRRRFTAVPDDITLNLHLSRAEMVVFREFWADDWAQGAAWVFFPVLDGYDENLVNKECRPTKGTFSASRPNQNYWRVQIAVEVRHA